MRGIDIGRGRVVALSVLAWVGFLGWGASAVQAQTSDGCPNAGLRVGVSAALPDCRAYELVSPAYKVGGIGVGVTYENFDSLASSGVAAYEGDRFAALGHSGSTLLGDGVGFVTNWAFADRTSGGWVSHNPFTHALTARRLTRMPGIATATDDLSKVIWRAQSGSLPIFPEMSDDVFTPAFFGDWEGRWEYLGQTDTTAGAGANEQLEVVPSNDGSRAVVGGRAFGMSGPGAPDHLAWSDRLGGRSVHLADLSSPPGDTFAASLEREFELVNVCTGTGSERTRLPARDIDGKVNDQACPDPLPGRNARLTSPYGAAIMGTEFATEPIQGSLANVVSADGSRAFFMSPDPALPTEEIAEPPVYPGGLECTEDTGEATSCPTQLYLRETDSDGGNPRVRWISRPASGLLGEQDASLLGPTFFEGASEDGDKVFFRTTSPLTADDPNGVKDGDGNVVPPPPGGVTTGSASSSSWDLYMYDLPDAEGADPGDGVLTRISGGPEGAGDCNNSQGEPEGDGAPFSGRMAASLRFASADGSRVYFVCQAPLPGVAPPSNGTITTPGGDATELFPPTANLYFHDAHQPDQDQRWRFVANLPRGVNAGGDSSEQITSCATTGAYAIHLLRGTSVVPASANCVRGRRDGSLVTFFTAGALTADDDAATADVYAYDADSDELTRISAPRGAAGPYTCLRGSAGSGGDPVQCYGDPGFDTTTDVAFHAPKSLLNVAEDPGAPEERVAFFQSQSPLIEEDENDVYDVYMWRDDELSLISTGAADAEPAIYKGNDRTGRNVYLTTRDSLTWQDADAVADVYVARVGGGIAKPPDPSICAVLGAACQANPGASPDRAAPATGQAGGSNASPGVRKALSIRTLGKKARRTAARTCRLRIRVRTNSAGLLRVVARARLGGKSRKVGAARKRVAKAGVTTVTLRLDRRARRALRHGRVLRVTVRVAQSGARTRAATVTLKRGKRS